MSLVAPVPTATMDTTHPNRLPRELTAMGQLKLVWVMMCLFARMMVVEKTKYRTL